MKTPSALACGRRRRHARLLEIGPRDVDVIVKRWKDFMGSIAKPAGEDCTRRTELEA